MRLAALQKRDNPGLGVAALAIPTASAAAV
jgi:hypothetical protein